MPYSISKLLSLPRSWDLRSEMQEYIPSPSQVERRVVRHLQLMNYFRMHFPENPEYFVSFERDMSWCPDRLLEKPEYFATFVQTPDRRTETVGRTWSGLHFREVGNYWNA